MTDDIQATIEDLKQISSKIADFTEINLIQLKDIFETEELENDFYFGIIRRQSAFNLDINTIIKNRKHNNYVSLLIIARCIIDDYIRLKYVIKNDNPIEKIIDINADALKKTFSNLENLAVVNEKAIYGLPPYYPTIKYVENLLDEFKSKTKNHIYFTDDKLSYFKHLPSLKNIVKSFELNDIGKNVNRAFYIWSHLSDYIHYSNSSFILESNPDNTKTNINYLQETLFYSKEIVLLSFNYFEKKHNISTIGLNNFIAQ
ncbi:MAG: hypothetical protein RBR97_20935 [Bacteroidales bacterium]|nr:hypothetical protein [Bacteroidales bacterium]